MTIRFSLLFVPFDSQEGVYRFLQEAMLNSRAILICLYALLVLHLVAAQVEEMHEEGEAYEYEYEYEGGDEGSSEVDVQGNIVLDSSNMVQDHTEAGNTKAEGIHRTLANVDKEDHSDTKEIGIDPLHDAEIARIAQNLVDLMREEEEERIMIQQRNQGKRGYKKAVASGAIPKNLPKIMTDKMIGVAQNSLGCVLAEEWGVFPVIGDNKEATGKGGSGKLQQDAMQDKADILRQHAQNQAGDAIKDANGGGNGESSDGDGESNVASDSSASGHGKGKKPKKPTFRELQAKKMEEKAAKEAAKAFKKASLIPTGTSCEDSLCASCKAVIAEFADAVVEGGKLSDYQYIEDIVTKGGGFCNRKSFSMRYQPIVTNMCKDMLDGSTAGYRDAVLYPFENDSAKWDKVREPTSLRKKTYSTCTAVGACTSAQFDMQMTPKNKQQEHWDDKCYVCQAFARELEERLTIGKGITETSVVDLITSGCDRVDFLTSSFREQCKSIIKDKLVMDISWIAYLHHEAIIGNHNTEKLFADTVCETIDHCSKWVDPDAEEEIASEEEVYF